MMDGERARIDRRAFPAQKLFEVEAQPALDAALIGKADIDAAAHIAEGLRGIAELDRDAAILE